MTHQKCSEVYVTRASAGDAMQCTFRSAKSEPVERLVCERMPAGAIAEGTGAPTSLRIVPEMHACLLIGLPNGALHHCLPYKYSIGQQFLTLDVQV